MWTHSRVYVFSVAIMLAGIPREVNSVQEPLAVLDFATGESRHLKIIEEPRPEARVMLQLRDGRPVMYESPLGYGKVLIATGPIGKNGLRRLVLHQVERRVVPLVKKTRDDGFHILPRTDMQGNIYLGVFNQNVSERVTDTLLVEGHYRNVTERALSGDWPVPFQYRGNRTAVTLSLAPGEATVLCMGSMLAARRSFRDPQAAVTPESETKPVKLHHDIVLAEQKVKTSQLVPAAKAEALSLLAAARRYCSFGYNDRAQRLMSQALATKTPGAFVSFPEDTVQALRAKSSLRIDGRADEWRGIPRYAVKNRPEAGGEFSLQWDDDNLYVLAIAQDSNLRKMEEQGGDYNWIWVYDGILLVLNPANTAPLTVGGALYDAKYRAAQTALLVSITGRKYANSACCFSAAAVRSAVQEIEGGYVIEVAIPLCDVMVPPVAGANIGFEF